MKKILMIALLIAPMTVFAQQKFGHVNSQQIIQSLPDFIKSN